MEMLPAAGEHARALTMASEVLDTGSWRTLRAHDQCVSSAADGMSARPRMSGVMRGNDAGMREYQRCRLSVSDGELELAGPPSALRDLGRHLSEHAEPLNVVIAGGSVAQEVTTGPLLVLLQDATTLSLSGSLQSLDIVWDALNGVAEQAETADDRNINRHQHIEYFPGDEYRSPDSVPLVVVADWPEPSRSRDSAAL
jgi:hypothetical protein